MYSLNAHNHVLPSYASERIIRLVLKRLFYFLMQRLSEFADTWGGVLVFSGNFSTVSHVTIITSYYIFLTGTIVVHISQHSFLLGLLIDSLDVLLRVLKPMFNIKAKVEMKKRSCLLF